MSLGCHSHEELTANRRVLWTVLALNLTMFCVELWQSYVGNSTSLLADSMDFLSDSFSYGLTLAVLAMPLRKRALASYIKAGLMFLLAILALEQAWEHIANKIVPDFQIMGWVSLLALAANVSSAALLYDSRNKDSNMRSIWLCSRNDAFNNIGILVAAGLVYATGALWPDLLTALLIAGLETYSAYQIVVHARHERRTTA